MNFQDDIPAISPDYFNDQFVMVVDVTSMQDATDSSYYRELAVEPFRLKLICTSPLEHVTHLF